MTDKCFSKTEMKKELGAARAKEVGCHGVQL